MPEEERRNLARIGQLDAVPFSADLLRKQRNQSDDDGELITDQALNECLQQAQALIRLAEQQLEPKIDKKAP